MLEVVWHALFEVDEEIRMLVRILHTLPWGFSLPTASRKLLFWLVLLKRVKDPRKRLFLQHLFILVFIPSRVQGITV